MLPTGKAKNSRLNHRVEKRHEVVGAFLNKLRLEKRFEGPLQEILIESLKELPQGAAQEAARVKSHIKELEAKMDKLEALSWKASSLKHFFRSTLQSTGTKRVKLNRNWRALQ